MTATVALPRLDGTRRPARWLLYPSRWWARRLLGAWYDIRLHGAEVVPTHGPLIYAANHIGFIDGPLLSIFGPRPVHALTKIEMFRGPLGPLLRAAGQIPLDRFNVDPAAVKASLRVLSEGGALGVFPEGVRGTGDFTRFHRGAAYFALVSGAPVVPVVFFGAREPGAGPGSLPRRGAVIDIVYGAPYTFPATPWPRTKEQVERASMLLREHLLVHLDHAKALVGRELPGPLPPGDFEPDPPTGVTDRGAP